MSNIIPSPETISTNQWCYHPERKLLEWLSEFHECVMEIVENHYKTCSNNEKLVWEKRPVDLTAIVDPLMHQFSHNNKNSGKESLFQKISLFQPDNKHQFIRNSQIKINTTPRSGSLRNNSETLLPTFSQVQSRRFFYRPTNEFSIGRVVAHIGRLVL